MTLNTIIQKNPTPPWVSGRVTEEAMEHLWECIRSSTDETVSDANATLAGNISKSNYIKDKDDWLYKNVLKEMSEFLFFKESGWNTYFGIAIAKKFPPPLFTLERLWVNYQKQHEFNPLHIHTGLYSFVIFMKIPTHWKEQHALPFAASSNNPTASDFSFVWSEKDTEEVSKRSFTLCPEDEGRILFFPASLHHMVYPFYGTEEERITISGNISLREDIEEIDIEKKIKTLTMMKNNVLQIEEELKQLEKEGKIVSK